MRAATPASAAMQVDVDVYRRAAGERQAPLPGAGCFAAEALGAWRELNTAADFAESAAEVHNWVQSLPLLVHHAVRFFSAATAAAVAGDASVFITSLAG